MKKDLTDLEQIDVRMYGITVLEMVKAKPKDTDDLSYGLAILSDAQHMAEHKDVRSTCQYINRAKFFILRAIEKDQTLEKLLREGLKLDNGESIRQEAKTAVFWERVKMLLKKSN